MGAPELNPGKAADAVLAEYASLRAELLQKLGTQSTIINLNLTAIAGIGGIVITQRADIRLLLMLPVISGALGLLAFGEARDATVIATYIRDHQAPLLAQYIGDQRLFQYERYFQDNRGSLRPVLISLVVGLVFPGISLASLYLVWPWLRSPLDWTAWGLGAVLLALNGLVWVVLCGRRR
ncbi:hypothetical protein [Catellatospora tritici]|uniref:hypothetical protein n=1 Tax=Catellatospora tritici TaxID=2851566 RepID=UPI001C2D3898|nr:hypothetical protein [Catellatospora tritici]MBV1854355.1 hypothetical protein [Catellatospora tritici]